MLSRVYDFFSKENLKSSLIHEVHQLSWRKSATNTAIFYLGSVSPTAGDTHLLRGGARPPRRGRRAGRVVAAAAAAWGRDAAARRVAQGTAAEVPGMVRMRKTKPFFERQGKKESYSNSARLT